MTCSEPDATHVKRVMCSGSLWWVNTCQNTYMLKAHAAVTTRQERMWARVLKKRLPRSRVTTKPNSGSTGMSVVTTFMSACPPRTPPQPLSLLNSSAWTLRLLR